MPTLAQTPGRTPLRTWPPPYLVPLPENRSALLFARRLVSALLQSPPRCPANPVLFHGPSGSGKSAIADAVHESIAERSTVVRITAADWPIEEADTTVEDVRGCDLLILEDLQHLPKRAADAVSSVLDYRTSKRRSTLVTASAGPARLDLPERLRSRLGGGLVVALLPLGRSSRLRLLHRLAERRGVNVADGVLAWLADRVPGSARRLSAAVNKLEQFTSTGMPLTLAAVSEEFRDDLDAREPSLERIVSAVSRRYQVTEREIRGPSRHPQTVWPRQVSMYLARRLTGLSLVQIGEYFGRDHTTVRHACEKAAAAADRDSQLPGLLQEMTAELA